MMKTAQESLRIFDQRACNVGEGPIAIGLMNNEIWWVDILGKQVLSKNIDSTYNQEEMVPKAIKMLTKKLETTTLNNKQEKEIIKQINMLKNSIEYI